MKEVRIYSESGIIPEYANPNDSGMDLKSISAGFIIYTFGGVTELEFSEDALVDFIMHSEFYPLAIKVCYHSGVHLILPQNTDVELRPKSSIYKKAPYLSLSNGVGTIDEGYRGSCDGVFNVVSEYAHHFRYLQDKLNIDPFEVVESHVKIAVENLFKGIYKVGASFAQLVITNRETVNLIPLDHWDESYNQTSRGQGGFGSTNK